MNTYAASNMSDERGFELLNISDTEVTLVPSNTDALLITRFVVQRILVPFISTLGFFGNIMSICVLSHRTMASSTNCYLTALAIFDLLYVVLSFTLSLNHYESVSHQNLYQVWLYYGTVLTDICSNVSVCLTVTFSLERLVAVCYPMKGRAICTPQRARIITTVVVILTVACTTPEFFEQHLVSLNDNNESKFVFVETNMFQNYSYQIGYYNFLVVTFTFLPLILLSTFNGILVKAVISATRIRKQMTYTVIKQVQTRRQQEQNRITIMLIGVVVVFLLCQFPNAALILHNMYQNNREQKPTPYELNERRIAGNIVNLLILINSSINFILYSCMSAKFRRVCLRILCTCNLKQHKAVCKSDSSCYNGPVPLYFRSGRFIRQRSHNSDSNRSCSRTVRFRDDCTTPSRPLGTRTPNISKDTNVDSGRQTLDLENIYSLDEENDVSQSVFRKYLQSCDIDSPDRDHRNDDFEAVGGVVHQYDLANIKKNTRVTFGFLELQLFANAERK